ncbi:uncharacterized protein LOC101845520 [Aplysia californica]|uniref:Uncharacterized protein LOC101845520 n=1 Tax=Aplysia californica TaxID=6500 RepID=A0ABM0KAA0_APLCA|nr:uncharacterized protein LOC101845520 [Aplysia californica]XP_005112696.1 uncharacterized protein LOC101845520 [Aplysia californica]
MMDPQRLMVTPDPAMTPNTAMTPVPTVDSDLKMTLDLSLASDLVMTPDSTVASVLAVNPNSRIIPDPAVNSDPSMNPDPAQEASLAAEDWARQFQGDYEMEVCQEDSQMESYYYYQKCLKNRGHHNFVPVKSLKLSHLPEVWRYRKNLKWVKQMARQTVLVRVNYTSPDRPEGYPFAKYNGKCVVRTGTGFAGRSQPWVVKPCPFADCKHGSDPHDVLTFVVKTAAHVVYDTSEAEHTEVDFFYDDDGAKDPSSQKSPEQEAVVTARGIRRVKVDVSGDLCRIECAAHDMDLFKKLRGEKSVFHQLKKGTSLSFIISHPHGWEKQVSFGKVVDVKYLDSVTVQTPVPQWTKITRHCLLYYNIPTCRGSSGANVFDWRRDEQGRHSQHQALHSKGGSQGPGSCNASCKGVCIEEVS